MQMPQSNTGALDGSNGMEDPEFKRISRLCSRIRILVIGGSKSGKTTILQKLCGTVTPIVRDRDGNEIGPSVVEDPTAMSRTLDIEHEVSYPSNPHFVFHRSSGFKAQEVKTIRDFANEQSAKSDLKDRLHAIWYCIPIDQDQLPSAAELSLFEHGTGDVPIIILFTKWDIQIIKSFATLFAAGKDPIEAGKESSEHAVTIFLRHYIPAILQTAHPPASYLFLANMHKSETSCGELLTHTIKAIDSNITRKMSSSRNSPVNIKCDVAGVVGLNECALPSSNQGSFHKSPTNFAVVDLTECWEKPKESPSAITTWNDIYKSRLTTGSHPHGEQLVAVKVARFFRPDRILQRLLEWMRIWGQFDHRNIVQLLGYSFHNQYPSIISPWYKNESLPGYISRNPNIDRSRMVMDCIDGLVYLHSQNPPVVHGDLRADNILVDNEGRARINSFGFGKFMAEEGLISDSSGIKTGYRWLAPELMQGEPETTASDVYGLVLLLLEIYTQKIPFPHLTNTAYLKAISKGASPDRSHYIPFNPSESMWETFEKGWLFDPKKRPDALEFKHMFSEALASSNGSIFFFGATDLTGCWTKLNMSPFAKGGYSDIYRGRIEKGSLSDAEQIVAVKGLRSVHIQQGSLPTDVMTKRLQREVLVWGQLRHGHIVPFLGYAFEDKSPCMVSPWYKNGCVLEYIAKHPNVDKSTIVTESIGGLVYLHNRYPPVIHGDIKASNILIDDDGHARIADFGLSRALQDGRTGFTTSAGIGGTYRWMAPELFHDEDTRHTTATDVYAFVLLALEIYTGKIPFAHLDERKFLRAFTNKEHPRRSHYDPFDPPKAIWRVFEKGWSFDPAKRPSANDLQDMFLDALANTSWR